MHIRLFHILTLLVLGPFVLSGAELQSEAASARVFPPYPMSGQRIQRSLQGLLAFLYGFRLGQGLATGFQTKLYNPLSPWYPQVIVVPSNQQQIVNLQGTEDVGENYQETNGDNVQTINNFAARIRLIDDSVRQYEKNKSEVYMSLNEKGKINRIKLNEFRANDKMKIGANMNASLKHNNPTKKPVDSKFEDNLNDIHNDDLMENTTPLAQTSVIDTTDEITTEENISQILTSTTQLVYPNRTHPYAKRNYTVHQNLELLSITTELPLIAPSIDKTYLHTLALPLENDNWQLFYKTKHNSGFKPIVGNYYYANNNEIYAT